MRRIKDGVATLLWTVLSGAPGFPHRGLGGQDHPVSRGPMCGEGLGHLPERPGVQQPAGAGRERVRLRVSCSVPCWHGALRLGLTSVPPVHGPQAELAIPNLTAAPGYWAAPVPEEHALPGSELQFWVTPQGWLVYKGRDGQKYRLLAGLDLSKPLWAMIDVYGQTCAVALLGSEKKCLFGEGSWMSQKSNFCPPSPGPFEDEQDQCPSSIAWTEHFDPVKDCAVCMSRAACVTLCCGHQCLCVSCAHRVNADFGTCPLCRQRIV
ncbi:hypothetical protein AAFF_G00248510 [Aldrovandia affinis]|uniref:E3 ubiquitin-protein ligase NEURL3 n=1 Tax=Aldrovandia affinis TaxID=143900 RepID=A0AAD7RDH2_9TELE|nr:hypothetical protein AAFF_G00248510 [Aldrovandia affinis]